MARLVEPGEWRLTWRWTSNPRLGHVADVFTDGTVYRFWCAWLFVKLMVKS